MFCLYIRLVVTIVFVIALCFSLVLFIKKRSRTIKFFSSLFSVLLLFVLILNFSDIYCFKLKSNDAAIIADTLGEKLKSITFNKEWVANYEASFEDDENMYWISCAPYSAALLDEFTIDEKYYSFAYGFRSNGWSFLIAPTVYHFDNSYFIGYHESPTQRILCYNKEVIIELQYSSYEYRNEPWKDFDFDYVLGKMITTNQTRQTN